MLDVIVYFSKKAVECCMVSKKRIVIITFLTFLSLILVGTFEGICAIIIMLIYIILYISYGMQFTREVINGGQSLPKFDFRSISLGIKATTVFFVYGGIQTLFLFVISRLFNFPTFDFEEFFLKLPETIHLIYTHNPVSSILFFLLSIITLYIGVFFMEIALAQLADGGKFIDAFNLKLIKGYIDKIGWVNYATDYTAVLLILVVLESFEFVPVFSVVMVTLSYSLIFIVEYNAIGLIFRKTKT